MKIAVLAMTFAGICLAAENNPQVSIEGYSIGEFAVKGTIEQQVTRLVVGPLSTELSKTDDGQVEFIIVGSADKIGGGAQNDRLAKTRAEEIREYLQSKFPQAKFTALTQGDERNVRRVTVSWKVTGAPKVDKMQADIKRPLVEAVFGTFALIIAIKLLFGRKKSGRYAALTQPMQPAQPVVAPAIPVQTNMVVMPMPKDETKTITVAWAGKIYSLVVVRKNGEWETPFRTKDGKKLISREEPGDVAGSLKSYLRRPEYAPMINQLIAEGKIQQKEMTA